MKKNSLGIFILLLSALIAPPAFAQEVSAQAIIDAPVSLSLEQKIIEAEIPEKLELKQQALTDVVSIDRTTFDGIDIKVNPISKTKEGIELYFKAWNSAGNKIGFDDGTVEIERLIIVNPPVLVPDGSFHDEMQWSTVERKNILVDVPNYRYDPEEALKQILVDTIRLTGKSGDKIIDGKIGHTTTVVYPDAGNPGTSSVDGTLTCNAATWTLAYAGTSCAGGVDVSAATTYMTVAQWDNVGAGNVNADRTVLNFALPSLGSDTIDTATVSFKLHSASNRDDDSSSLAVYSNLISSDTTLASTDFPPSNYGSTQFSSGITLASIIAAGAEVYTDIGLNATGIAAITPSSTIHFAIRDTGEVGNTSPGGRNYLNQVYQADATGSTNDPKLTVVSSSAPPPPAPSLPTGGTTYIPTGGGLAVPLIGLAGVVTLILKLLV